MVDWRPSRAPARRRSRARASIAAVSSVTGVAGGGGLGIGVTRGFDALHMLGPPTLDVARIVALNATLR